MLRNVVQRGVPGHEIGEERWHVYIAKTFPPFLLNPPNLRERGSGGVGFQIDLCPVGLRSTQ